MTDLAFMILYLSLIWIVPYKIFNDEITYKGNCFMAKKKIAGYINLTIKAGKAAPAPPVGPALGARGLNIMEFCKAFNAQTADMEPGTPVPVVITAYADRSFTFVTKDTTC